LNERDVGRTKSRRLDDIKTYLTKKGWERIYWTNLRIVAVGGLLLAG
jgi:hypothetical protein